MYKDYPVDERSDALVREIAKEARSKLVVLDDDYVDLISTLRRTSINTRLGVKELQYEVGRDEDLSAPHSLDSSIRVGCFRRTGLFWQIMPTNDGQQESPFVELVHGQA